MIEAAEVCELAHTSKMQAGPLKYRQQQVRDLWGGDIAVPLTELYANEQAATANLLRVGVDGKAQRIGSTRPEIRWHVSRPGFRKHEDRARQKRQVSLGWHHENAMDLIRLRRARQLVGYGESPVRVGWRRYDRKTGKGNIPDWDVRDPLQTYAAPPKRLDDLLPVWVLRCYPLPLGYIRKTWPDAWSALKVGDERGDHVIIEVVEYADAEETVLVAVGRKADTWEQYGDNGHRGVVLERIPNLLGRQTIVLPGLIGLTESRRSRVDGMVGKYLKAARLDALQGIAIEEGIFPKQWLVARQGEVPKIIQVADPRKGQLGIVTGGVLDTQQLNPGYKTDQALADLERAQRNEAGIPASYTAEAISGARTARMADTVEGGATDFDHAEIQKILARSEQIELEIAADLAKAYAGNVSVSLYVSDKGAQGAVTYRASDLFEGPCGGGVTVEYPMAGTDLNQQVQRIGHKQQLGLISDQTAREMDPEVRDAELEKDRITAEGLEKAVLTGFQQLAVSAAENPGVLEQVLRVAELVRTNRMELIEAGIQAAKEAKEAQAALPPPVPEGMAAAPETMPGLGAPSQPLPNTEAPPDLGALAGMLRGGA